MFYCRLKAYIVFTFVESFWNKSGKPQPIRTKVGSHAQIKGRQSSQNFRCDRLSGGKTGGSDASPTPRFFCQQYKITFRQLCNGRFSPNLATTRESWVKRRFWKEIYEKFQFMGHLPLEVRGQTGTSLRAGYRSRDALQRDTVYSML